MSRLGVLEREQQPFLPTLMHFGGFFLLTSVQLVWNNRVSVGGTGPLQTGLSIRAVKAAVFQLPVCFIFLIANIAQETSKQPTAPALPERCGVHMKADTTSGFVVFF